jgi:fused signal recognition particle receptor
MFDSLRKKLSEAIKGIVKKEEKEEKVAAAKEAEAPREEAPLGEPVAPKTKEPRRPEEEKHVAAEHHKEPLHQVVHEQPIAQSESSAQKGSPVADAEHKHGGRDAQRQDKPEPLLKTSIGTKIKGAIFGSVRLSASEIDDFSEKVRVSLLESEVSYDSSDQIAMAIRNKLETSKLDTRNLDSELRHALRESLLEVLGRMPQGADILKTVTQKVVAGESPVRMLFLGPNGTGKTTTMAKIAHKLLGMGLTCVFSASDTFRAAAIEQTEIHASRLGIPVVKSGYGADPASVAFDAIAYARSHGINVVLIDSAGRQETNKNLVNELHKIVRVAKPDIVVFVGESTAGSNLSDQIIEFNKVVKIDGIVLTKLDCDAKGGNAISVASATGIPIIFFGVGESYDAMVPYSAQFVVDSILPNN